MKEKILPGLIEGDSFHKYERQEMRKIIDAWERTAGRGISHFGPEANVLEKLEALFSNFSSLGQAFTENTYIMMMKLIVMVLKQGHLLIGRS